MSYQNEEKSTNLPDARVMTFRVTPVRHARSVYDKLFPIFLITFLLFKNGFLLFLLRAARGAARRATHKIIACIAICHTLLVIRATRLRGPQIRGSCWLWCCSWCWLWCVFGGRLECLHGGCEVRG
jgi:hypothetical protein